jgi:hypothetical protein
MEHAGGITAEAVLCRRAGARGHAGPGAGSTPVFIERAFGLPISQASSACMHCAVAPLMRHRHWATAQAFAPCPRVGQIINGAKCRCAIDAPLEFEQWRISGRPLRGIDPQAFPLLPLLGIFVFFGIERPAFHPCLDDLSGLLLGLVRRMAGDNHPGAAIAGRAVGSPASMSSRTLLSSALSSLSQVLGGCHDSTVCTSSPLG